MSDNHGREYWSCASRSWPRVGGEEDRQQHLEVNGQIANSITTVGKDSLVMELTNYIVEDGKVYLIDENGNKRRVRIRKLTPRECWRLMDFDDADFDKAAKVNSNTQLYKQAGNSIVVSCLEEIIREML